MEIDEGTYEQRMLQLAERQTTALEALRNFALILLTLMGLAAVTWVFFALAS